MIKLKMAKPVGYNVLIKDRPIEEKKGNIFLPDEVKEQNKHGQVVGTIAAVGALAFTTGKPGTEEFKYLPGAPKIGDSVIFNKYAGGQFWVDTEDGECRLVADNDVLMIVEVSDESDRSA